MEQTMHMSHSGWSREETELLRNEVKQASETGAPLRVVFERMGETLGRKPNSVRNYYYMQLRGQEGEGCKRAAPFETFTEEEIHDLLRHVLAAKGQGQSVRASVMDLSHGDKTLMLRYQNKYRALLRKRPDLIEAICRELKAAGEPCPDMTVTFRPIEPEEERLAEETVILKFSGLPSSFGLSDKLYCVFAIQTGILSAPSLINPSIACLASLV